MTEITEIMFFKGTNCVPCTILAPRLADWIEEAGLEDKATAFVDDVVTMRHYGLRTVPAVVIVYEDGSQKSFTGSAINSEMFK